jgi:hypothetical protein
LLGTQAHVRLRVPAPTHKILSAHLVASKSPVRSDWLPSTEVKQPSATNTGVSLVPFPGSLRTAACPLLTKMTAGEALDFA